MTDREIFGPLQGAVRHYIEQNSGELVRLATRWAKLKHKKAKREKGCTKPEPASNAVESFKVHSPEYCAAILLGAYWRYSEVIRKGSSERLIESHGLGVTNEFEKVRVEILSLITMETPEEVSVCVEDAIWGLRDIIPMPKETGSNEQQKAKRKRGRPSLSASQRRASLYVMGKWEEYQRQQPQRAKVDEFLIDWGPRIKRKLQNEFRMKRGEKFDRRYFEKCRHAAARERQ